MARSLAVSAILLALAACSKEPPARWTDPTSKIEFALLSAGDFVAGSPDTESGHQPDEKLYPVRIARPFYMSTREVSRGQWAAIMSPGSPPGGDAELPVVDITWHEALEFVDRLSRTNQGRFRLPTEIEWEYACRAGTTSAYSTGAQISTDEANYNGDFPLPGQSSGKNRGALLPTGSFAPNAWGLHDMHGNAWEWTSEGYDDDRKVIRGGSWRFNADSARCALRYHHRPGDKGDSLGVRVVRDVPVEP